MKTVDALATIGVMTIVFVTVKTVLVINKLFIEPNKKKERA